MIRTRRNSFQSHAFTSTCMCCTQHITPRYAKNVRGVGLLKGNCPKQLVSRSQILEKGCLYKPRTWNWLEISCCYDFFLSFKMEQNTRKSSFCLSSVGEHHAFYDLKSASR